MFKLYQERLSLIRNGKGYKARCPFHDDKNPSFNLDFKDGVWVWSCFPCVDSSEPKSVSGGDIINFVQKYDKLDFKEAVRRVEDGISGSFEGKRRKIEDFFKPVLKQDYLTLTPEFFGKNFEVPFASSTEAQNWLLSERGITYETAKRLHFGYRQNLPASPENSDVSDKGWLAIPCTDERGTVLSIEYRSIHRKAFQRQKNMDTVLFNIGTIDPLDPVFVTEGKFDAAILEQHGFHAVSLPNATAKIAPDMKSKLLEAGCVILAGDSDETGTTVMERLWADLQERTFLLKWPVGMKDANQTFLEYCSRDPEKFKNLINDLVVKAKSIPMPNIYSLQEVMLSASEQSLMDHPYRLRFPWPSVDNMAILLPGSILFISATNTGQGKSTFVIDSTLYQSMKCDEVVLNYQCEMTPEEIATLAASHIAKADRNHLTRTEYERAAREMGDCKYYVGRNASLTKVNQVLDLVEDGIRCLGATVVVLDHIHFICRNESDEIKAQANAMQRIKNLADKYKVKFIVVGQPRKAVQKDKGKSLHITDMKGSESLTSDASAVMVIHRDYAKIKDPKSPLPDEYRPETMLALLKGRTKGDGNATTMLLFNGKLSTFSELDTSTDSEYNLFDNGEGVVV